MVQERSGLAGALAAAADVPLLVLVALKLAVLFEVVNGAGETEDLGVGVGVGRAAGFFMTAADVLVFCGDGEDTFVGVRGGLEVVGLGGALLFVGVNGFVEERVGVGASTCFF